MSKTINALTETPTFANQDYLPLWHAGKTFKIAMSNILTQILESVDPLSLRAELVAHMEATDIHHTHANKPILDALTNVGGKLYFLGDMVTGITLDDVTPLLENKVDKLITDIKTRMVGQPGGELIYINTTTTTNINNETGSISLIAHEEEDFGPVTEASITVLSRGSISLDWTDTLYLNGQSLVATATQINSLLNISGNVQSQLDGKATLSAASNVFLNNITVNSCTVGQGAYTGRWNTAVGVSALQNAGFSAQQNTAFGYEALKTNTSGGFNTAFGANALRLTTATNNTAFGASAGAAIAQGQENTLIGAFSGQLLTIGAGNTAIGSTSLSNTTSGGSNTAIGVNALMSNTTYSNNTALGFGAGSTAMGVTSSTFLGYGTGSNNGLNYTITIGANAWATKHGQVVIGDSNVNEIKLGSSFVIRKTTSGNNITLGFNCIDGGTPGGTNNLGIGSTCLQSASFSGSNNVAVGSSSLSSVTSGSNNIAIGNSAMPGLLTGANNIAIGLNALSVLVGAESYNVAIGTQALENSSGSRNLAIGYRAGSKVYSGGSNVILGYDTSNHANQFSAMTNSIVLGYQAYGTKSNQVVLGNTSITELVVGTATVTVAEIASLPNLNPLIDKLREFIVFSDATGGGQVSAGLVGDFFGGTVTKTGTGTYLVEFTFTGGNTSFSGYKWMLASVNDADGFASATATRSNNNDAVIVKTFNTSGVLTDAAFSLSYRAGTYGVSF